MGLCTKRRVYVLFLSATILQIITSGARQVFDFLGPLWSMIFSNFLNIVFAIFGFFGGYTRRKHYLISYIVWSVTWLGWNVLIIMLYIPVRELEIYRSSILSLGTGGISWWWTRAPGCVPDWGSSESPTQIIVTNCLLDPHLVEIVQAGLQTFLAVVGIFSAIFIIVHPYISESDKDSKNGDAHKTSTSTFFPHPGLFSLGRSGTTGSTSSRSHSRSHHGNAHRAPLSIPSTSNEAGGSGNLVDDRLRPMTPRKVKRRSARSIQSQRFGPVHSNHSQQQAQLDREFQHSSKANSASSSARNSLRSNVSRRSMNHRNSKRKTNQFVSPINRLMQQVDSETSHDERYPMRDQGHVNPVYLGPGGHSGQQSGQQTPTRPPSARSSYSNYHPARIPVNSPMTPSVNPNVFNLNQNIFTNPAFDNSPEYNESQHSNNTSNTLYEDEINFHPNQYLHSSPPQNRNQPGHHMQPASRIPPMVASVTPSPNARTINPHLPNGNAYNNSNNNPLKSVLDYHRSAPTASSSTDSHQPHSNNKNKTDNQTFVYPLAHSPISQESFPMWGVAPAQVPSPNQPNHPPYRHPPNPSRSFGISNRQPINSETVI